MFYKIDWVENKSPDWKIASITGVDGTKRENVSINRVNKKGEVFPNFDKIVAAAEIEGETWESAAGKWYLFAPKVMSNKPSFIRRPAANIAAAMDRKETSIGKFQDKKEESIQKSGAQRDAVLIVTTFYKDLVLTDTEIQQKVKEWMKYFIGLQEQPFI